MKHESLHRTVVSSLVALLLTALWTVSAIAQETPQQVRRSSRPQRRHGRQRREEAEGTLARVLRQGGHGQAA